MELCMINMHLIYMSSLVLITLKKVIDLLDIEFMTFFPFRKDYKITLVVFVILNVI